MKSRVGFGIAIAAPAVAATYLFFAPPLPNDATASPEPVISVPAAPPAAAVVDLQGFLRGNIHVHTWMSDGDSDPKTVVAWYAEHGYDFVAITDHNRRVDAARYGSAHPGFLVVPGEEVTMAAVGKPIHVNALCTEQTIGGAQFKSRPQALTWAVTQIRSQGGIAMVNHPNFAYALDTPHIAAAADADLLDIYNGHPQVHVDGSPEHTSTESKWQELLDQGRLIAPAAVDDAHAFSPTATEGIPNSRPGTGWIGVAATERTVSSLCQALRKGHLYASNGAEISRIRVDHNTFEVWLPSATGTVEFIGTGGHVVHTMSPIASSRGWTARYVARSPNELIRARITSPEGRAWTPAFRVGS